MSKPPQSPPSSDIEGADQDAVRNTEAALASGQDAGNLELARKEAVAKPPPSPDRSADDRSR